MVILKKMRKFGYQSAGFAYFHDGGIRRAAEHKGRFSAYHNACFDRRESGNDWERITPLPAL